MATLLNLIIGFTPKWAALAAAHNATGGGTARPRPCRRFFLHRNNPLATGGGHPAAPNGGAGAGNRPGSLDGDGSPLLGLLVILLGWLLIGLVGMAVMSLVNGCTAAQDTSAGAGLTKAASEGQQASTFLVGSATTRPSPVVTFVEAAAPLTTPYITAAGTAIALGSAGLAALGTWLSNKGKIAALATQVVDHKSAIAEVVGDVKNWSSPTVSFTAKTEKIVADAAGIVAAAPTTATAITDLTVTAAPVPAAATPAAAAAPGQPAASSG